MQYHGWLVIEPSPDRDDVPLDEYRDAAHRVREALDRLPAGGPGLADLRMINGALQLHVADAPNHNGPRVENVLEILRRTARDAPGSYGLIYVHDDEDPHHPDEFRVIVIRRGEISEHPDPFLSPVEPTIEGP